MIAFPTIPDVCVDTDIQKIVEVESQAGLDDTLFDDTENYEAVETIYKHIQNHKIPSIHFIIWTTVLAELFVIIIPLIIMLGVYYEFAVVLEDPVNFMKGIADTRDIICMLTAFAGRYILQSLDDPYDPSKKIEMEIPFRITLNWDAFAGYSKTIDIIRWIAQTVSTASEVVSPLRNYKVGDPHIEKVRDIMFTKITNYSYYLNNTFKHDVLASTTDISYQLAAVIGRITDLPEITVEIANGADSLTARNNCQNALLLLNQALLEMIDFLKKNNKSYQLYFELTIILAIVACAITYPTIYLLQIKKLRRNRYEVLYVLTTLPKTVTSSISASYTSRKGDETKTMTSSSSSNDIELNKQEESIIKLFSSISDGSSKASIELVIGFCILLITVLGCLSYYVSMQSYISASENVVYNCHHINYLFGANSYLYSIMASFFKISMAMYHPALRPSIVSLDEEIDNIKERIPMLVSYFQMIRLGGEDRREIPFSEMQQSINDASNALTCFNILEPPTRLQDSTHCLSAAQQLYVATMIMKRYYGLMTVPNPYYMNPSHQNLPQLWQIGPVELYLTFFWHAEESIVPIIVEKIGSEDFEQNFYSAMFIISTSFLSLIIIVMAVKEDKLLKFTLKLFLKCPSSATLGNQRVMDLLIGNYTYKTHDDQSQKSAEFTNDVVNRLNEVIIVCQDETGKVISVNNSFETMFGIKEDEIRDTPIQDFFKSGRFIADGEIEKVFTQGQKLIFKKDDTEKIYLDWTTSVMSGRRIYSGRDETQNMMHEKLIADEKKKSDQMLASILPPMLVQRVQAGEKNISFSVQSATVLFLDVVEFTPWCGSHDAQYVMRMLNIMFKEFDAITNAHKTMTKIKCIGNCYMAAGGIFDEVNQPAVHAKEVVDFGTLVIKKLLEIDEREKENLRIRVGINTGGPIVAGVIGTEKPTFEILGPAINMAHEMENKGVPMKVHISRPVYELIYGQQFEIKERGEIDVKGGKMFTYLVEP
ncbi:Adenylate and Guanylate cyclase catalytic domain containing protein [Trichomonas vaginalis G3]|uniref:Adenylate and Guanylate cyclase catalytic domain containing protein n=3 Tax=Trichomonas vaginalis (strain ATCC PRA-98 / G3) TaxID=412133 RepID=A2G6L5_TRIV3|nr:Adenylate and Guanylate cyclase catalytic domain containing protein [Trichomonas vaginalis G3]|eukprot:XP_001300134.1 Adenylate and Guanylate cyclase catalytic domain containing protein [Trichomonas vaginalis G3]